MQCQQAGTWNWYDTSYVPTFVSYCSLVYMWIHVNVCMCFFSSEPDCFHVTVSVRVFAVVLGLLLVRLLQADFKKIQIGWIIF